MLSLKQNLCFKHICYIVRTLPDKEKIILLVLIIMLGIGVLGFLWKINALFLVEVPADGGTLREGIIGTPRFINPLLAISEADRDLTALIYSGLMRSDGHGGLIPDLAEKYEISEDGLSYTFTIKSNAIWHDGKPVTSDDVIFTIQQVKNPNLKSPRRANWEGVEVEKIDERTVRFWLKRQYAPFIENTTLGILPKHLWKDVAVEEMGFNELNIQPIGSGPYRIDKLSRNSSGIITSYELERNKNFVLGKPHIKKLIFKFYSSEKELLSAYKNKEIDSMGSVSPQNIAELTKSKRGVVKTLTLPRTFGVFFNQNNAPIFSKYEVRKALNVATDKERIIKEVLAGFGTVLNSPIPPGTFGALDIESSVASTTQAQNILKAAGWEYNQEEKVFEKESSKKKETMRLEFSLATSDAPELVHTAELLKTFWEELGAKVNVKIFEIGDLNQNIIRPRKYDALLFGEVVGSGDPDPFAFWHSSQRNDPGLNIALYANSKVDKLLEEARAISDPEKRKEKYELFQKEIQADLPAVFLYSPHYLYIVPESLKGFETYNITMPHERFSQIHNWYIKTRKIYQW